MAAIKQLEGFELEAKGIADAGLTALNNTKSLVYLRLDGTAVSDGGMQTIGSMTQLSSLFLKGVGITDKGIITARTGLPAGPGFFRYGYQRCRA